MTQITAKNWYDKEKGEEVVARYRQAKQEKQPKWRVDGIIAEAVVIFRPVAVNLYRKMHGEMFVDREEFLADADLKAIRVILNYKKEKGASVHTYLFQAISRHLMRLSAENQKQVETSTLTGDPAHPQPHGTYEQAEFSIQDMPWDTWFRSEPEIRIARLVAHALSLEGRVPNAEQIKRYYKVQVRDVQSVIDRALVRIRMQLKPVGLAAALQRQEFDDVRAERGAGI